ncbi:hypothetical protein M2454_000792 [Aequitasia blattaphilus]
MNVFREMTADEIREWVEEMPEMTLLVVELEEAS